MIKLTGEAESTAHIKKKHERFFTQADKLWQLTSSLLKHEQALPQDVHFHTRWVILAFHARQMRTFRAIVLLLERGLVPEAQILLRPLFETDLQLQLLEKAEDQAKTAREFLLWYFANDEKLAKSLNPKNKAKHSEFLDTLGKLFIEERARLGKDGWKRFTQCGPSMLSVDALATKLKREAWYNTVYRSTSAAVHGFNIPAYAKPTKDGKAFVVNLAPVDDWLDMTIDAAFALLCISSLRINRVLKLGKEKEIRALDEEQSKWLKERMGVAG